MFRLLAAENGFVHVCGHRGNSIASPENTLAALTSTAKAGGTSAEIDVMLTSDGELVLMHDDVLDRTTDGTGLVSNARLADIARLDAGSWFGAEFAGERVPTLAEALDHARRIGLGLVVEVKEAWNLDGVVDRLADLIASNGFNERAILISFDHAFLKSLKERLAGIRTEGIVHARHADIGGVARAAELDSVSIEHLMFRPEDGEALHADGVAVRLHLQRPAYYARYADAGVDLLAGPRQWIAGGVVDTVSGDDVAFLRDLAGDRAPA
ncbi:MAG TPA: glycerophosphodiester phosphodiesterase family protein [Bauldia sp.]|nr:glycerophosphodiester phosphodiesterase family protein [Bauldia sp.]